MSLLPLPSMGRYEATPKGGLLLAHLDGRVRCNETHRQCLHLEVETNQDVHAGKSTLLDILADYKKTGKVEGKIYMNGRPVGKRFRRLSAYVSQEDVFVPTMSAWETLTFHAALRLGNSLSKQEKVDRMSDVLRIMGLWRSRDTQVHTEYLPLSF